MNKRDANKKFNRQAILDAARKVFAQEGFARANITQIIEISGFSTGTFYNYFQTKDELMEELSLEFLSKLRDALLEAAEAYDKEQDIDTLIHAVSNSVSTLLKNNPEDIQLITRNQIYFRDMLLNHPSWQELVDGVTRFIKDLIEIKEEAALISQILLGAFVVMFAYLYNHEEADLDTIFAFMRKYLRAAFKGFKSD